MPGIVDAIKTFITGDPLTGIRSLIEEFHLSPEDKLKAAQFAQDLEMKREEIQATRDAELARIQGENIRAETTSEDPYVRRARPTFLYVMVGAIGMALIIFPLLNLATGKGLLIPEIPPAYLELFGVGFLGYTGARTWEKLQGKT